jgi:hypothetical protein
LTVLKSNVLGTLGYVCAFKYFTSVIIAMAALLESIVAAFTATAMGVGVLPGVEGWIGNFLVIAGTVAVLYPTTKQGRREVKKEAATPRRTPRLSPYPRMRSTMRPPNRQQQNGGDGPPDLDVEGDLACIKQQGKRSHASNSYR